MAKQKVLLEFESEGAAPFSMNEAAVESPLEAVRQAQSFVDQVAGMGIELDEFCAPVPMMIGPGGGSAPPALETFATEGRAAARDEVASHTVVVPAEVPLAAMEQLQGRPELKVWPNSPMALFDNVIDEARSDSGLDCRPFKPAVEIEVLRALLAVDALWNEGYRGQNIVVGIIDEGVDGSVYPVIGGFSRPDAGLQPGGAPVTSHGSMCAADVLVAAPHCRLYDYPFLGVPRSGGALQMFQAVLNQRGIDGTPHITNNSYGFVGVPDPAQFPDHEVHNIDHPVHRKVREVVTAGVTCFFAAGNCGENCPSGACHHSGIGPGRSVHASNSLAEVITVAAVNSRHERIGYSSQGPGMFEPQKPDIASYSHFFGNFGPGRPADGTNFDNGTSAATPVAAGVGALLMSAIAGLTPDMMKRALTGSATNLGRTVGWDAGTGHGVLNAAAAYGWLRGQGVPVA
ncbi:S8 family peptidase [Mesorhizobium xinjiangense]|uniref:S8 family peptidase n=1 Tax=Mesorhizobium xinjiangense TaxID=2678685 RepID=UPI0012EDF331|nr:S8 family serine peptidase [Mesorhizobium xinjiangense]